MKILTILIAISFTFSSFANGQSRDEQNTILDQAKAKDVSLIHSKFKIAIYPMLASGGGGGLVLFGETELSDIIVRRDGASAVLQFNQNSENYYVKIFAPTLNDLNLITKSQAISCHTDKLAEDDFSKVSYNPTVCEYVMPLNLDKG